MFYFVYVKVDLISIKKHQVYYIKLKLKMRNPDMATNWNNSLKYITFL